MEKILLALILFLSALSGCPTKEVPVEPGPDHDRMHYDVYSAFIEEHFGRPPLEKTFLICSDTVVRNSNESVFEAVKNRFHDRELDQELLDSFRQNTVNPKTLSGNFQLTSPYTLISNHEIEQITTGKQPGFEREAAIRKKFPDSFLPISFSSVGYNRDRSKAIFFFRTMGADSRYIVMRRERGKWKIEIDRMDSIV